MEGKAMTLARISNPWFSNLPSMIDRFFEGDVMDWNRDNFSDTNTTLPAVNIKEDNDQFMIEVAVPGMKKEDFRIDFDNGRLTISSERKNENVEKDGEKVTRREFSYQSFQRSFTIPENMVNADKISAKYENGILYLNLPKREEIKPKPAKQIAIS